MTFKKAFQNTFLFVFRTDGDPEILDFKSL